MTELQYSSTKKYKGLLLVKYLSRLDKKDF